MSFITEFLRYQIRLHMADPEERQEMWVARVRKLEVNSQRKCAPLQAYLSLYLCLAPW